jgi:hypothetical protein
MEELKSGEGGGDNLNLESVLKFTAVSMHVLNTICNNSKRMDSIVQTLTEVSETNRGDPEPIGKKSLSKSRRNRSPSAKEKSTKSKQKYIKFARKL